MRYYDFVKEEELGGAVNLITTLELLRHRYSHTDQAPKINTQSLINMVRNTDQTFDYNALVAANEENEAVKNLIKSFNTEEVILNLDDPTDDPDIDNEQPGAQGDEYVDDVESMAKRAAKKRGAPVSE